MQLSQGRILSLVSWSTCKGSWSGCTGAGPGTSGLLSRAMGWVQENAGRAGARESGMRATMAPHSEPLTRRKRAPGTDCGGRFWLSSLIVSGLSPGRHFPRAAPTALEPSLLDLSALP